MRYSLALGGLISTAIALQEGFCDYKKTSQLKEDHICINNTIQAEAEFTFDPLFKKPAKFVYAVDNTTTGKQMESEDFINEANVLIAKESLVGWWIEYDDISFNNTDKKLIIGTEARVAYTNVTKSPGGGNNGCDELLGSDCLKKIRDTLTDLYFDLRSTENPFEALTEEHWDKVGDSCPEDMKDLWGKIQFRSNTISWQTNYIAIEAPSKVSTFDTIPNKDEAMPSGNWSFTYSKATVKKQFVQQLNTAAVAVFLRGPARSGSETNIGTKVTKEDANVGFACAKLSQEQIDAALSARGLDENGNEGGEGDSGSSGAGAGSGNGDGGSAANTAGVHMTLVLAIFLVVAMWI